jgi:DNA-binding transcriptional MerR regulator
MESADTERLELMRSLRDEGKSLQEIADVLGYKNRSSVSRLLKE